MHEFLNDTRGTHMGPRNQGGGHNDKWVELMFGFFSYAKFYCLDHILHFVVLFPSVCGHDVLLSFL